MDTRRRSARILPLVVGLALAFGRPARAAEPSREELSNLSLEELMELTLTPFSVSTANEYFYRASNTVTGSRTDTPISDLPFAIQAFTTPFTEDQRPENIFDVVKFSPGVTYRSNDFNEGNANLALRGFAVANKPGDIQILRDGLRGPSIFDFTNIDRVEVIKGPASFLYGQLAPGGMVNVITKTPQPRFAGKVLASFGAYDAYRVELDLTGPVTKDLFVRLAASFRHDIRYWDPYDGFSGDVAPSLFWKPNDWIKINVKFEHFLKRETPPLFQKPGYGSWMGVVPTEDDPNLAGVDVPGLPANWNSMAFGDYRNSDTNSLVASVDARLSEHWDMRVRYGHQDFRIDAAFTGNFGVTNGSFIQGRRFRRQTYDNTDDTFEAEAVGKYRFEFGKLKTVSLRFLLGAQLNASTFHRTAGQAPNDPALGNNPASPLPQWDLREPSTWDRTNDIPLESLTEAAFNELSRNTDRSIYAGATVGLFHDRLLLLAGARFLSNQFQFISNQTVLIPDTITNKLAPQVGILAKPRADLSLFASFSQSFVPNPQPLLTMGVRGAPAQPTQGTGFDVGVKTDLLGGKLSGTATFFYLTNSHIINDIAALDPVTGTQSFTTVQSGQQRSIGAEFDATLSLTEDWQVVLSYSVMDAKIVEFTGDDATLLASDPATLDAAGQANYKNALRFHGAPLQMSAPHLANLWTRYGVSRGPARGLWVAGGANLVVDQTLLPDTPKDAHQTYALFNATIGYRWPVGRFMINVDLTGKNLSAQYYRPSQSTRPRPFELAATVSAQF